MRNPRYKYQKTYEKVMQLYNYSCAECFTGNNVELHHR